MSLFFLSLLCLLNYSALPALLDADSWPAALQFMAAAFLAFWVTPFFVRGRLSVLLHELKHALLSGFAGNRARNLSLSRSGGGEFEYEYTQETAPYNAFISLAPYITPLFSLPVFIVLIFALPQQHSLAVLLVSLAYGADLRLNLRDISPRQTDITHIRGGFAVGLLYILVMNLTIFGILAAWVLKGTFGLRFLLFGLWQFVLALVAYYRN